MADMTKQEIDSMAEAMRSQGLTWGQVNFTISLFRNFLYAQAQPQAQGDPAKADACDRNRVTAEMAYAALTAAGMPVTSENILKIGKALQAALSAAPAAQPAAGTGPAILLRAGAAGDQPEYEIEPESHGAMLEFSQQHPGQKIRFVPEASQPAAAAPEGRSTWCSYIAGMIGTYLRLDCDGTKVAAIAGIIERRLHWLPDAKPAEAVQTMPLEWRSALRKLAFMAETSGGTAGPDTGLMTAISEAKALLDMQYVNAPSDLPAQQIPEIKGAWIDGGYVIVTPAGRGMAAAVKAEILAHFPVQPKNAPQAPDGGA